MCIAGIWMHTPAKSINSARCLQWANCMCVTTKSYIIPGIIGVIPWVFPSSGLSEMSPDWKYDFHLPVRLLVCVYLSGLDSISQSDTDSEWRRFFKATYAKYLQLMNHTDAWHCWNILLFIGTKLRKLSITFWLRQLFSAFFHVVGGSIPSSKATYPHTTVRMVSYGKWFLMHFPVNVQQHVTHSSLSK